MTKEEMLQWIKTHKAVDVEYEEHDSSGNYYVSKIYTDSNGKFFKVEFMNAEPVEKWAGNGFNQGFVRGEYDYPQEVIRKTRVVEEVYYEETDNRS